MILTGKMDKVTGEARIALMGKKGLETDLLEEILSWMPRDKNCKSSIAYMYRRQIRGAFEDIKNNSCFCEGGCDCDEGILEWVSKAKSLFNIQHCYNDTNHKLEKMIEIKVVMNYLENQMGIYSYGKLLCGQNQRIEYTTRKFPEIQQYHPMFYHCNKDIIKTCLVIIIRNAKLDLNNYEELYDQFY